MGKMKRKQTQINEYAPGLAMRLLMLGIGIFVVMMHFPILLMGGEGLNGMIFFLLLIVCFDGFMLWYGIIFATQYRVFVSEEGIEMQRGASRIFTSWENISHIGIRAYGKNQQMGVYLYERAVPSTNGLIEKLFWGRSTDFISIGDVIRIPWKWGFPQTKINHEKLAHTPFGRDVLRFAPHLIKVKARKV